MSLKKNIAIGVLYTGLSRYFGIFISIGIGAVLARLLSPSEFGIVAIVMVFITFFNLLSDFGLGPAIVQNKSLNTNDVRSLFSFSILLSIGFCLFFLCVAPFIANFYNNQDLAKVSKLLSLSILFCSLRIVPYSLHLKELRFKIIGITTISVQAISGILAILLAYNGFSYYALVYKAIFDALATFLVYFFMSPIRPLLKIKWKSIKKVLNFSIFQFLFNFINYFSRNADNLLIGKYFGAAPLGFYNKSYQLMLLPVQNLTHIITPVLLPVLSEFQNDKTKIFNSYCLVVKLLAIIGFPLSIVLYFVAPELILVLYGAQWVKSIPLFTILSLTVGFQIILSSAGSIYQTANRTDLLFLVGLTNSVFMIGGILFGIFFEKGLIFVSYGLLFAFIIGFFISFFVLIKIVLKQPLITFFKLFIRPLITTIAMSLVLYCVSFLKIENILYALVLKLIVAFIIFLPFFISDPYNKSMMSKVMHKLKN